MQQFRTAHSTAADWGHAAKECVEGLDDLPEGSNLGFVYVTDVLADDLTSIVTFLRETTGVVHWVGTVGMGVCTQGLEIWDKPAVAVMVAALPDDAFRVIANISGGTDELSGDDRAWISAAAPSFGLVHADPTNADMPDLIEALARDTAGFLVGGLSSSRSTNHQVAERVTKGGVSGVLFSPDVNVATGLSQGCVPIAERHVITESVDNVIMTLDGQPALDVFKEDVGELLARDLNRVAGYIHAAFPVAGSDTGDYTVRNLVGIDPENGWLAVGDYVETGDAVMFVRRDPNSAAEDLVDMLVRLKRRIDGQPRGGVYVSCVARGANMFGESGREMAMIRDALGEFPLVGFYAGGEISNNRLYGYTGVLTLFL